MRNVFRQLGEKYVLLRIAVVIGFVGAIVSGGCKKADLARMEETRLVGVILMLENYHDIHGRYPDKLSDARNMDSDFDILVVDMWDTPLEYRSGGNGYHLTSAGPDRRFGSPDDMVRTEEDAAELLRGDFVSENEMAGQHESNEESSN